MLNSLFHILGIDIGSVSIHIALLTSDATVVSTKSEAHHGDIRHCLFNLIQQIPTDQIRYIAATDSASSFINTHQSYDDHFSLIRGAKHFQKQFDALLHIGGEKFSLSRFNEAHLYQSAKHNTSCAAGTGSFLDQQARRLNLSGGSEVISRRALMNTGKLPEIATRCAVFAKTDLIHAQQEGYGIEQICDGLCYGLAKNITNTLFKLDHSNEKIVFCGGVAHNHAVKKHLENITGCRFTVDSYSKFYAAAGAALCLLDDLSNDTKIQVWNHLSLENIFLDTKNSSHPLYPPLELKLSSYPEFKWFSSSIIDDVETDIFLDPKRLDLKYAYLGLDVGSTSTKSILINHEDLPVAGFYTKTASRPVDAVKKIFKACEHFLKSYDICIEIKGCGTTGSGRRLAGRIIGADIEPDEITAHAKAACYLNPGVDTIIEIGGQDAKFTLLKDGIVTSSVMNTVCAAGTGSFIEEQSLKLGCELSSYSGLAEGVSSPMSSDRCTVFMERDINYYFAQGYSKNEILASVLHSVRDNYLTKVASIGKIGNCIHFQGATAKNKALVAAFEQKLKKPIHVSPYCHLTGALGVALMAKNTILKKSKFRGFNIWRLNIPVHTEICQICTNYCKLTIAKMNEETLAYGFLCGRDYQTNKMIPQKKSFSLLKARHQAKPRIKPVPVKYDFTIGIPHALHLHEDLDFWVCFFSRLGIKTVTSEDLKNPVKLGKNLAKAEFCAPVIALHGHIEHLMGISDYVFLPFYFEDNIGKKDRRRQHCYYTQFSPSVISCLPEIDTKKLITPLIKYLYTNFHTKLELYKALRTISSEFLFSFFDISAAYDHALEYKESCRLNYMELFKKHRSDNGAISVILLGRPYTVLTDKMNNHIPRLFENLGVNVFFMDMLDLEDMDFSSIDPLLREIHWKYVAQILKSAFAVATAKHLYPVYISSFKCAPDAFGIDYFKQIMEDHNKPYLILELDEHDSNVGYETRIEAAIQAFSNHNSKEIKEKSKNLSHLHPRFLPKIGKKIIMFPNWDNLTGGLIVSVIKNEGYKAFLMEETNETLKKSILTNTGQCIPLNAVASAFIHTVEKHDLNPSDCALWLNPSEISCNIKMYPYHIKKILERHGNGFDKAEIYKGELSLFDISFRASTNAYFAYMFGGLLRSIGCKIRPYEIQKGQTDKVLDDALKLLCHTFEAGEDKETSIIAIMKMFMNIPVKYETRPKIGIFGDLYVRDNDVMNQNLIRFIETHGGEAITTPYYKYLKIIANSYFKKWFKEGKYISLMSNKALLTVMQAMEKKYYKYFEPILGRAMLEVTGSYEAILPEYGMLEEHTGESMDNILKIHHLIREHPDLKLLVQTNPAFCCPGLITDSMGQKLEKALNIPIVSITYDISGGNKNQVIIPFLKDSVKGDLPQHLKISG